MRTQRIHGLPGTPMKPVTISPHAGKLGTLLWPNQTAIPCPRRVSALGETIHDSRDSECFEAMVLVADLQL